MPISALETLLLATTGKIFLGQNLRKNCFGFCSDADITFWIK